MNLFSACCPHCKSVVFRGVGVRNSLEALLVRIILPYRCSHCGKHFFLLRGRAAVEGTA